MVKISDQCPYKNITVKNGKNILSMKIMSNLMRKMTIVSRKWPRNRMKKQRLIEKINWLHEGDLKLITFIAECQALETIVKKITKTRRKYYMIFTNL